jgi:hypothetical protein
LMSVAFVVRKRYHVIVQKVGGSNLSYVCMYVCICMYLRVCVCVCECHTLLDPILIF